MPIKDQEDMTNGCISSLAMNTVSEIDLIIIDDCSTEDQIIARGMANKYIKNDEPLGVTVAWNLGLKYATGDYVCIVNNDILFSYGWDLPLIKSIDAGAAVASPYHTQHELPADWPKGSGRHDNGGFPLLGCCFMSKRSLYDDIGLFPDQLRLWYNDNWLVWICTKKGYNLSVVKDSYIHHFYSKTINITPNLKEITDNDKLEFDKIMLANKV